MIRLLPIMSSLKSLIFQTFSNYFTSSNRAKSVWQSSYLVLNSEKRVYHIKHPLLCSIKAIFPLFHYDGEPSVSNGIVSQLPSYHLFIHWVPTKLSNRVMPYGGNFCRLQLLFVFDFTDHSRFAGYGYSVDASPCFPSLVSFLMQHFSCSIFLRFLSRTLLGSSIIWNPARLWFFYAIGLFSLCCQAFRPCGTPDVL